MLTLHSSSIPSTTVIIYAEALTAARTEVPHGWVRQANPHRLGPAFKAAGDAARGTLARAGIGDREPEGDMADILTRIDNFVANPGNILDRRKTALALSSKLTNAITRHTVAARAEPAS
jgi:hypothetical protein